mmetsp:Transcript_8602/g.12263  ORF Transcript_8602/g.12263 Transcript_8602/m.12263 type:complete len:388 (+) Transcript_8602:59-1222(+)
MTEIQSNSIDTSSCDEFEDVEEQRTLKDEDVLKELRLLRGQVILKDEDVLEELRLLRGQVDDMRIRSEKQERIIARLDPRNGLRKLQSIRNTEEFCNFKLDEDTYSLMMTSKVRSGAWLISLFTSLVFQLGLAGLIGIQFFFSTCGGDLKCDSPFDVPLTNDIYTTIAQLITIILVLATQSDVLSALQTLIILRFRSDVAWDEMIGETGNRSFNMWFMRIFVPNMLKIIQGVAVLFASFLIIVQSSEIIELLKDFTSLLVISEADNIIFYLADMGFLGEHLAMRTAQVKNARMEIRTNNDDENKSCLQRCNVFSARPFLFIVMCSLIVGGWWYVVHGQCSGQFLRNRHENCDEEKSLTYLQLTQWKNGYCNAIFNNTQCDWDGGDCK